MIKRLSKKFKITYEGVVSGYLGMRYRHTKDKYGNLEMRVDQTAYIQKLIERFELTDEKWPGKVTPLPAMAAAKDLEAKMGVITDADREWMERHPSMPRIIGSLIHAMVHTRPDIAYAVSLLSRTMADPQPYHYKACKHVLL